MKSDSRVLITGASGLVGSAVVEHFRRLGFSHVISFDRSVCDLTDKAATERAFSRARPDHVFHAAGRVYGILGNMNNHGLSFYDNLLINTNVIEAARLAGVGKITVMGTGAVYPYPSPDKLLKESTIFLGRPHVSERGYADAKRAMLAMLEAYADSYGLKWAYVVSCNLFGPRDRFDEVNGHVVPSLIRKFHLAKTTKVPINVWGDGSARRDFMYVRDAARVIQMIMESLEGPVNIGSGRVLSIRDIVDMLGDITGLADLVRWDPGKPNGQEFRGYSLERIATLDFSCDYTIAEGLKETWEWYVEHCPALAT